MQFFLFQFRRIAILLPCIELKQKSTLIFFFFFPSEKLVSQLTFALLDKLSSSLYFQTAVRRYATLFSFSLFGVNAEFDIRL